jgi:hypothetical protein
MPLFVYLDSLTIINSYPVILLLNQDAIILTPGIIITGGIAFPSAEIHSIIVIERRFSGIPVYISLILIRTTTSSPASIQTRASFSSILYINLL